MSSCDVAIVGAGPYGLSVAAHLGAAGVDYRIFGSPMEFWTKHMPKGMHLKSEGFASSLFDPGSKLTLGAYCAEKGIPYSDRGTPVPLDVFSSYGMEFQRRFVPGLEHERVVMVKRLPTGFQVTLSSGEKFASRRVVIAVGLTHYQYLPSELAGLSKEFVTHSSAHSDLSEFKGRAVAVVGAGASALDLAALLNEIGAKVNVIARVPSIRFQDPPENLEASLIENLRAPVTGIGAGWKLYMCAKMPLVFRMMPENFRIEKVRRILGPAPCWFIRERVVGKVELNLGSTIQAASMQNGRMNLEIAGQGGSKKTIVADHVIAATGFKVDVSRLPLLDAEIISYLRCVDRSPALSSNFESSVKDLYFIGVSAANTFGPLLRFAYGVGFAAPRVSGHLTRTALRAWAPDSTVPNAEAKIEQETAEPAAR